MFDIWLYNSLYSFISMGVLDYFFIWNLESICPNSNKSCAVASHQDPDNLVFTPLYNPHLQCISVGVLVCVTEKTQKWQECDFLKQIMKTTVTSGWMAHSRENQTPRHSSSPTWRCTGRELKPPANSQHQLASYVSELSWKWNLQAQGVLADYRDLISTLSATQKQASEPPS